MNPLTPGARLICQAYGRSWQMVVYAIYSRDGRVLRYSVGPDRAYAV